MGLNNLGNLKCILGAMSHKGSLRKIIVLVQTNARKITTKMKVLIAIDDSSCSSAAVDAVASHNWPAGTELRVITVLEPVHYAYALSGSYMASLIDAEREMDAHCRKLVDAKVAQLEKSVDQGQVKGLVIKGSVVDSILSVAKEWDADLIVLGSHGRKGFDRFLLGSAAEKVANYAPCSVEIVRQKQPVPDSKDSKLEETQRRVVVAGQQQQE